MRALGVARVSTKEQASDQHFSFAAQRQHIQDYCAQHHWQLVDVYEYVRSGGSNQRELEAILARVKTDGIQVVVVNELDRLARDMVSTLLFLEELQAAGARFASVTDALDLTTPEGELQMHILAMFAAYFRRQLSRKVKAGQAQRAQAGKRHGGQPYGYRPDGDTWAIDPGEATTVRRVYHWYLEENWGLRAIAQQLNREAIPGQRGRVGTWEVRTVARMLRREAYAGDTVYGKWEVTRDRRGQTHTRRRVPTVIRDTHPAIIDRATWQAVQDRLARKHQIGPRAQGSPYLLSGLLRCGVCGTSMVASHGRHPGKTPRYVCRAYHTQGQCSLASAAPMTVVHQAVQRVLEAEVAQMRTADPTALAAVLQTWHPDDPAVQAAQAADLRRRQRLTAIPAMIAQAEQAMLEGIYTPREFGEVRRRLQAEAEQLTLPVAVPTIDREALRARMQALATALAAAIDQPRLVPRVRPQLQQVLDHVTCAPGLVITVTWRGEEDPPSDRPL